MRVILKKNTKIDNADLKAGAEGWLRGITFGDNDIFFCDFGDYKMLPMERTALSFPKNENTTTT